MDLGYALLFGEAPGSLGVGLCRGAALCFGAALFNGGVLAAGRLADGTGVTLGGCALGAVSRAITGALGSISRSACRSAAAHTSSARPAAPSASQREWR